METFDSVTHFLMETLNERKSPTTQNLTLNHYSMLDTVMIKGKVTLAECISFTEKDEILPVQNTFLRRTVVSLVLIKYGKNSYVSILNHNANNKFFNFIGSCKFNTY